MSDVNASLMDLLVKTFRTYEARSAKHSHHMSSDEKVAYNHILRLMSQLAKMKDISSPEYHERHDQLGSALVHYCEHYAKPYLDRHKK